MLLHKTSSNELSHYLHRTSTYPEQHPQQNLNQHLIDESKNLQRTSSYPENHHYHHLSQNLHFSSEPVPAPKASCILYPLPDGRSPQFSPNHEPRYLNAPYHTGGPQMLPSFLNIPPQLQIGGMPQGLSQFRPPAPAVNNRLQNQFGGNLPDLSNGVVQQHFTHNGTQQHQIHHQFQPSFGGHISGLQPPMNYPPPFMKNFEPLGMGYRDFRPKSVPKGSMGPGHRYFHSAGGAQLRQRRELLLEGLATSLQLVDPLGKTGQADELVPKDDLVFLRLVSLSKGRKLLSSYLKHLPPKSEWTRVVCMAVFRQLRFLFGVPPIDPGAAETITNLAMTVSSSLHEMELRSLGACLASVVCSLESPPLRPIGSPAGDRASFLLKSVLERATELLTNSNAITNCSPANRAFWQASFDGGRLKQELILVLICDVDPFLVVMQI
ncbi:hypothetical protein R6Q57_008382 [Mikania cordata]